MLDLFGILSVFALAGLGVLWLASYNPEEGE